MTAQRELRRVHMEHDELLAVQQAADFLGIGRTICSS
jgi:hypothetical protein